MTEQEIKPKSDDQVISLVKSEFPDKLKDIKIIKKGVIIAELNDNESLLKLCRFLKSKLNFKYLLSVSALDWPEHYEVIYHVVSYENNNLFELHTKVPKDNPEIMSMVRVWKAANAHEREAFDMMGIVFKTHPDLRRILLPEDVIYYPLRKDFPLGGPKDPNYKPV